jgi:hypothetical protein
MVPATPATRYSISVLQNATHAHIYASRLYFQLHWNKFD